MVIRSSAQRQDFVDYEACEPCHAGDDGVGKSRAASFHELTTPRGLTIIMFPMRRA
jgi:hypothetical protein